MERPYRPRLARVRPDDTPVPRDSNFLPRSLTKTEQKTVSEHSDVKKTQDVIARRCTDPSCSLKDVAAELGKSERTVQRVLEKSGSAGFRAELHEARMKKGSELLAGSGTVQQVAKECGFKGAMHFAKAFRRWSGKSPTEYRASLVAKSP